MAVSDGKNITTNSMKFFCKQTWHQENKIEENIIEKFLCLTFDYQLSCVPADHMQGCNHLAPGLLLYQSALRNILVTVLKYFRNMLNRGKPFDLMHILEKSR